MTNKTETNLIEADAHLSAAKHTPCIHTLQYRIDELKKENAALVAALEWALARINVPYDAQRKPEDDDKCMKIAKAALANAKVTA